MTFHPKYVSMPLIFLRTTVLITPKTVTWIQQHHLTYSFLNCQKINFVADFREPIKIHISHGYFNGIDCGDGYTGVYLLSALITFYVLNLYSFSVSVVILSKWSSTEINKISGIKTFMHRDFFIVSLQSPLNILE